MRYQDHVIRITDEAARDIMRAARAVPADKLEWKPLGQGRSVLDQMQEVAQAPTWYVSILEERAYLPWNADIARREREMRSAWPTLDEVQGVLTNNSNRLYAVIRDYPDEDLEVIIKLPFGENVFGSMADVMLFHYWNTVYHLGQINYVQTLYGDFEMG